MRRSKIGQDNIRIFNEKTPIDISKNEDIVPDYEILIKKRICKIQIKDAEVSEIDQLDESIIKAYDINSLDKNPNIIFNKTGILKIGKMLYVIFPFGYKFNKEKPYKDISMLIKLLKYSKAKIKKILYRDVELNDDTSKSFFIAYDIINDFIENGNLKTECVKEGTNISGKINWKKTLRLKPNLINDEGMPFYTSIYKTRKDLNIESKLSMIHKYVIESCINMYGALWGVNVNDGNNKQLSMSENDMKKFLTTHKNTIYNSKIVYTIDLLIKFLSCSEENSSNGDSFMLVTDRFYVIWENICKSLFYYNTKLLNIPQPYWKSSICIVKQIPDIVYQYNEKLYVLDAKYYNCEIRLPGWHDLVKQFFYEVSLRGKDECKKRYNIMLLPGETDNIIEYKDVAKVRGVDTLGCVGAVILDTKEAIDNYLNNNTKYNYRDLLETICNDNNLMITIN